MNFNVAFPLNVVSIQFRVSDLGISLFAIALALWVGLLFVEDSAWCVRTPLAPLGKRAWLFLASVLPEYPKEWVLSQR
jgi:hypothetical protein